MKSLRYNPASVESIVAYAEGLIGYSLADLFPNHDEVANRKNRGDLGGMVQKLFFGLQADSRSEADFSEAGLELKTTGVRWGSRGEFVAKERLVLMMIDYEKIVDETWETSSFLKKCRLILLLAYLYDIDKSIFDRKFVLRPMLLDLLDSNFSELKADWEWIRQSVKDGKAHELSEGDTFVLGACRKGSGGASEKLRKQPFSEVGAKSRAFSFRQTFVNQIIQTFGTQDAPSLAVSDVRNLPHKAFRAFLGKSVDAIASEFDYFKESPNQKGYHRLLAMKILTAGGYSVQDLQNLGIEMKTVRLTPTGNPREAMSFPGFSFMSIVNEDWEESSFFQKLESKFLFIIFAAHADGSETLHNVSYWNMPYSDRLEAERVWKQTQRRVSIDATDLPKSSESPVAHVRPKGRDGKDTIPTPQGTMHLKQCFWLNRSYIRDVVKALTPV
jgi:DNA mismatch repair protein MutH